MIEKWDPDKVWTAVLIDADNDGYPYLKRFVMDAGRKRQNFLGDNVNNELLILTDIVYPRIQVTFTGADAMRPPLEIDAESFIGVKGFKAKGKRITTWHVGSIEELEPLRMPQKEEQEEDASDGEHEENLDPDAGKTQQQVIDEMTGQLSLFNDNDE